jgi:hypothetical protein
MKLELTEQVVFALQSLAYAAWTQAYDNHKELTTKYTTWESQGKFCPKSEFSEYYAKQLENAVKTLTEARAVLDAIAEYKVI